MLIACKCLTLCKNLHCDTKNEPPYFVTTQNQATVTFTIMHVIVFVLDYPSMDICQMTIWKENMIMLTKNGGILN